MIYITLFLKLLIAHFLCDFPLQGTYLANHKCPNNPAGPSVFIWCMIAHVFIQAGAVWYVTGSILLFFAELVVHYVIDIMKCASIISFSTDQLMHVLWKVALVAFIYFF